MELWERGAVSAAPESGQKGDSMQVPLQYWQLLYLKGTDVFSGLITIAYSHYDQPLEVGYNVLPQHQRKGSVAQALFVMLKYHFEELCRKRLLKSTFPKMPDPWRASLKKARIGNRSWLRQRWQGEGQQGCRHGWLVLLKAILFELVRPPDIMSRTRDDHSLIS